MPKKYKRISIILVSIILIAISVMLIACAFSTKAHALSCAYWTERQQQMHDIAEQARAAGLAEDNPIIVEASRIWWEENNRTYTDEEVRIIATVVYYEAWGGCTDRHRELVAAVVCNRVKSDLFPDTVYDVVAAPGQYLKAYADGTMKVPDEAWDTCKAIAEKALRGEVDCPDDVLFQAEFRQGVGTYEVCKTSYSTTYFCYGG